MFTSLCYKNSLLGGSKPFPSSTFPPPPQTCIKKIHALQSNIASTVSILYNKNGILANLKSTIKWGKRRKKNDKKYLGLKFLSFNYSCLGELKEGGKGRELGKKEKKASHSTTHQSYFFKQTGKPQKVCSASSRIYWQVEKGINAI